MKSPEVLKVCEASPESSFRELDDAFLQTQTRIWLGEVLHIRFNEETPIADLLADGELLFQVSKAVWKMLVKKYVDLKNSKVYIHERTSFGKSEGRYMPYPKVDSFLKICQILGLTGIDLFSPTDVVEKRDIRRVCMCIRSLSKRARLKNLNVPDFDIVTYTIAMPTDMVGGIRRNLEQSQYSSSSSSGCSDLREMYRQKRFGGNYIHHDDSYSESDEAESCFNEFGLQSPLSNSSREAADMINKAGQLSNEGYQVGENISELQTEFKLDNEDQTKGGHTSGHHGETILSESVYYPHLGAIGKGDHEFRIAHQLKVGCFETCSSSIEDPSYGELNGEHSVMAKEAYERYISSSLWEESFRSFFSGFSASDIYTNAEHSKEELIKASPHHGQVVYGNQEDSENVRSECRHLLMETSKNTCTFMHETLDKEGKSKEVIGCSDMPCKNISGKTAERIEESSNGNASYVHANDGIDDTKTESFNFHWPSCRAADGLVNAEISSLPSLNISSAYPSSGTTDGKISVYNDKAASSYIFPEVGSLDKVLVRSHAHIDCRNNNFSSIIEDKMNIIDEELMNTKLYDINAGEKAGGLSTFKKHNPSSEDGISRSFTSGVESTAVFDPEMPISCSIQPTIELRSENVDSSRSLLLSADKQQNSPRDLNHLQSNSHSSTISKVNSAFTKDDLVLPRPSDTGFIGNKNLHSSIRTISDGCGKNGSKYDLLPYAYSTSTSGTPEDGGSLVPDILNADNEVVLATNHEIDIDEQLNNSFMPIAHKDDGMPADSLSLEKDNIFSSSKDNLKNNTANDIKLGSAKTQPMTGNCSSEAEGEVKVKFEQQNTSCELYKDLLVKLEENAEELNEEDRSNWHSAQQNASYTNTSKYDSEERKLLVSLGLSHMDRTDIHGLEDEDVEVHFDLDIAYKHCVVIHETESKDIHVVHVEAASQACSPGTVATHDPVDHDRVSTQFADASMRAGKQLAFSAAIPLKEKEITTEVKDQVLPLGDDLRECVEHKEAEATKNRKKSMEESDEERMRIQNSSGKDRESAIGDVRSSGNKVLRSVVGGMTFVGTLLIFLHLRRRRGKENIRRTLGPLESQKSSQVDSTQRQLESDEPDGPHSVDRPLTSQNFSKDGSARGAAEIGKSSVLYPGERLKF